MISGCLLRANSGLSSAKHYLTVVRHGESIWNKQKRWAGWTDVPLSSFGIKQAKECAQLLKARGIHYEVVYTSMLSRAIKSANYILDELDIHYVPVHKDWRLNEKHYGALQGLSKVEVNEKHGEETVTQWRRSMTTRPPPLDRNHDTHPSKNPIYKHVDPAELPDSESLSDIIKRLQPLWDSSISQQIKAGKNVLVVGHGSSIRAILHMVSPNLTEQEIKDFNIPNATPIIFSLDADLKATGVEYLGDENEIAVKMSKIKYETKRKEV